MNLKQNWFLIGMVASVALAWVLPDAGAKGGWLYPEYLTKGGVALIFFLHGASLSFASLKAGTLRWPLHLVVQACTYLLFPLIGLLLVWLVDGHISPDLRLGLFFLCALPSTVSSSVAMTAAARGNVPAAVFNATLSGLLGVFLTPLWIGLLLKTGGHGLPLGKVILDLVIWLILPLVAGQVCRPFIAKRIHRHKKMVNVIDRLTILMLVYTSFCDSVKRGIWSDQGLATIVIVILGSVLLFFIVMNIVAWVCNRLGFTAEDRIAALFCGSKKSLATGVPMAQLIFVGNPGIGLILLPIMVYHPIQLLICGWLAGKWAKRTD